MQNYTLSQIAELLSAELQGDGALEITKIATLAHARSGHIAFLANKKYRSQLEATQASAVIVSEADAPYFNGNKLIVSNPYVSYAKLAQLMDTTPRSAATGIHPSAVVHPNATVSKSAAIGANTVIESNAIINDNVQIGPNSFIGEGVKIGSGTKLWSNVTIYHNVEIGSDCLLQANSVIGSDGFGYANERGQWIKIPQLGSVIIGDKVEIGASTTIDRGALDDTIIHSNVIIDNQCQIAHNVEVNSGTAIAGCTVLAGSVTIGKNCQIGGMTAINGHMSVCDGVIITGMSMVTKSITEPGIYSSGIPHTTNKEWRKSIAHLRNLSEMKSRIKALEQLNKP
ncbi:MULTISPECIES: UDP-3-O-(3-hydroxymyristoyl)glucosamine N-acyltransferase [unclassified Pseudoalteromonas]|uniref:UDP-3-O-(3-hydroxymyristoyl)glucosamine N-acyltransferase n=1 Tax=unclassified Pseudoalteromonas TaxID=194690 RepID=UPI00097EBEFC|nr:MULTISPECIES: UDP-3-O-(3-hydroxymyristoyl)glucosamine N-acyltransferase [unclassified Pseudoalteromonas]MBB1406500.1 UDP-3-O-(3-hydroxymyristoyl)glucosamine N-acyltransferase [Pseudoalteromonas sp. SG44-5]MBO7926893.1 UDP-3-O-(3-hydroxymyristoyl)glucosamine N-acyltransferase [Pseudoalteromonas sp. K222D]PCC13294.1 UDP-3-O-(3-hydroxymyristoyl)glucosamine N-acyltransferase [Pseudoalteromonas sp. JB197]SJN34334.1 UDP-3-O-[3-hydroxymyristoyl] glucosamine N-acyltransferase [Pseudoalteromonas sp. 